MPAGAGRGSQRGRQRERKAQGKASRHGGASTGGRSHQPAGPETAALPELQEKAGNQAVTELIQRLVGDAGEVADPAATGAESPVQISDNPLTGLTQGDGFKTPPSSPIRERVKKLQNKLNVKLPAKLGVDGAFGEKTALALQEFQRDLGNPPAPTVDEDTANVLLDRPRKRDGPDDDKPPGPKPNGVDLGPLMFNTALEATFDEIVEQYGAMLSNQGAALNDFRTDLANPESKQPGLMGTLLTEGANFVIDRTLGDAETSLRNVATSAAKSVLDSLPSATPDAAKKKVVEAGVTAPFKSATEHGKEVVKNAVGGSTTSASVADFVATQHAGQIASHRNAVSAFQKSKNDLRQFTPEDAALLANQPIPGMVDPRLDRAAAVLDGVRQAAQTAPAKTYREVVSAWATVNARRGLAEHGSFRTDVTEVGQLQDAGTGTVLGVLEVTIAFDPRNPKEDVRVKELHIAGLSAAVRNKLMGAGGGPDLTIGKLGFPVRIQGSEGGGLLSSSTEIAIAAPEDRRSPEKVNKGNTSADEYLKIKGADAPGLPDEVAQFKGMARIVQEVDGVLVKAIGLQGP